MNVTTLPFAGPTKPLPSKALVLFTLLQGLDFLTTITLFSKGGAELNPLVGVLIPMFGSVGAVAMTKALLIFATWRLSRHSWVLYAGNILYCGVVVWNVLLILSSR